MNELTIIKQSENESRFKVVNGVPYVSSLYVAEITEKEHKHIMRDIRNIVSEAGSQFSQSNFGQSKYLNERNREYDMYWLTEDGSSVLLGGYSIQHRVKVQTELRRLKDENSKPRQYSLKESLQMNLQLLEEKEKLELENKQQQEQIVEMKPKVEFAETISNSDDCLTIAEFAKVLCNDGVNTGRNRLYKWLKGNGYLRDNNEPYQRYIDYFKIIEKPWTNYNTGETKINIVTLINGKGQNYFYKKIKEYFTV